MQSTRINGKFSQWREVLDGMGFSKGQRWDVCCSVYAFLTWEWSDLAKFMCSINLLKSVIRRKTMKNYTRTL